MFGMNEKVLLVFTPSTLLKFSSFEVFKLYPKQTLGISPLSYDLPQGSDGPSYPQVTEDIYQNPWELEDDIKT